MFIYFLNICAILFKICEYVIVLYILCWYLCPCTYVSFSESLIENWYNPNKLISLTKDFYSFIYLFMLSLITCVWFLSLHVYDFSPYTCIISLLTRVWFLSLHVYDFSPYTCIISLLTRVWFLSLHVDAFPPYTCMISLLTCMIFLLTLTCYCR